MEIPLIFHAAPVVMLALLASIIFTGKITPAGASHGNSVYSLSALFIALFFIGGFSFRHYFTPNNPTRKFLPSPSLYTPLYLPTLTTPYNLNFTCSSSDGTPTSCSPSFCSAVDASTTPACVGGGTQTAVDPTDYLSRVTCSTCTVSSNPRCTTAALTALFGGVSSVYAAFCNANHLVIITSNANVFTGNMDNTPYPPGGSNAGGTFCRTRTVSIGAFNMVTNRVILNPILLPAASKSNNLDYYTSTFDYIKGSSSDTTFPLPQVACGWSIAGQDIFPIYNNRGTFTPEQCEVDSCNQHTGVGGGQPHLHGDPFGPSCLYGVANYSSVTMHPPVIGF